MNVKLSRQDIEAIIFDMDGTMVANMEVHREAWRDFFIRHGKDVSAEDLHQLSGKKNDEILKSIFGSRLTDTELSQLADEKEALYRERYKGYVQEVSGLKKLLIHLQDMGIKLAVATSAPMKNRELVLQELQLTQTFKVIVGDEDIVHGKPDPEIYIHTASLLDVDPARCVVFEDSPSGVASAKAAGMRVVAVLTSHEKSELHHADYFVDDFAQIRFM